MINFVNIYNNHNINSILNNPQLTFLSVKSLIYVHLIFRSKYYFENRTSKVSIKCRIMITMEIRMHN